MTTGVHNDEIAAESAGCECFAAWVRQVLLHTSRKLESFL